MMKSKWDLFNFPYFYLFFIQEEARHVSDLLKYEDTNQSTQGTFFTEWKRIITFDCCHMIMKILITSFLREYHPIRK